MAASGSNKPPCRACTDFKTWSKMQRNKSEVTTPPKDCPVDSEELGRATWTFLHTMAAYYPENPSYKQQKEVKDMMTSLSNHYPCDHCAYHMRRWMKKHPPNTTSGYLFKLWMCQMHNEVNERLGKALFDCSKVDERWLSGWKDGSCD